MNSKANRHFCGQNLSQRTVCIIALALLVTLTNHGSRADNELSKVATSEKVLREKPIVIETQVQNYDQPTLNEYTLCHENRDNCLRVCASAANRTACEQECPTCPILISQDVVVQGVNDTDYRLPAASAAVNTTNIIRLTNEIHNIIDNKLGNITARNENNINIHQNISDVGGEFGLGYNANGSCCIVVRRGRNCDAQRFSTAARCHHKRHRVCGERCKSRVMYAKRVTHCDGGAKDDLTHSVGNCQQRVEYVPYKRHRRAPSPAQPCHYTQQWPFVACHRQQHRRPPYSNQHCRQCLQLPYGYILQHGIPPHCVNCYTAPRLPPQASYAAPYMPPNYAPEWQLWPPAYYQPEFIYPQPPYYGGDNNFDDELMLTDGEGLHEDGVWKIEKTKCRRADGSIIENCHNNNNNSSSNNHIEGSGDSGSNNVETDPLEHLPVAQDDFFNFDDEQDDPDYYEDLNAETVRRRRQAFHRSAYSRRHRQKF